ncbi:MAG TPA: exodeoxyribonuclease VII large subunit [Candidatus Dormibacteraeota bacterium]
MAIQPQEAIKPLTVLELNTRIHDLLAARFQSVVVKGEVSGVSLRGGHVWFTLKDATAVVGAVIFSGTARRLPFLPENGQELVITGQVDYHAQYGRVNLVVSRLDYDGAGKVRAAIEQLKRRLEAEGAFRPERKRALPFLPRCIAFITSPSGAVIHDLQQTIWERFPNTRLVVYPALVQGTASQRSLVAALRQCDQDQLADVVIVARGGGSFEELMAFNQEAVVRAIQAMRIPVVTALGHTSDRTLADLVADREARTPTAAAEIVVPNKQDLLRQLRERGQRLQRAGLTALITPAHQLQRRRSSLERVAHDLTARRRDGLAHQAEMLRQRDPREVLRQRERSLQECRRRLQRTWQATAQRIETGRLQASGLRERLIGLTGRGVRERAGVLQSRGARLTALAPEQTLKRGYSICLDGSGGGGIIREADQARKGQPVKVLLSVGRLEATVDEAIP